MSNIGYATLSVIPSARNFGSALSRDIDPQMHAPGLSAGKVLGAGLVAGAAIAAVGIAAVFKTGLGEAMDASAGTAQLAAGIASTGNAANVSVDGMNALASSIQKMSGQTDDSIVASEQLLLTFTNIRNTDTDKIFDRATAATADMAAKMGGDAAGSAIQLGKALNDPIAGMASLGRMGVQFTDGQKETIRSLMEQGDVVGAQNVILGELETQFGGAAAAAGQSLPGQLEIAKRSFEDVSQAVVEGLLPVVLPGLTSIGDTITARVIPAIGGFIEGFKNGEGAGGKFRDILTAIYEKGIKPVANFITGTALPGFRALIEAFKAGGSDVTSSGFSGAMERIGLAARALMDYVTGTVIPGIASLVGWFKENSAWLMPIVVGVGAMVVAFQAYQAVMTIVRIATGLFAVAQGILNAVMAANPIGIVVLLIVGLVAALVYAWNNSETFRNIVTGVWDAIKVAVSAVADWFTVTIPALWDSIVTWTTTKWNAILDFFRAIPGAIVDFFMNWTLIGLLITHWDSIKATAVRVWDGLVTFVTGIPGRFVSGLAAIGTTVRDSVSGWVAEIKDGAVEKFTTLIDWVTGIPDRLLDGLGNLGNILKDAGIAIITGLWDGLREKWGDVQEWVGGIGDWIAEHKGPRAYDLALLKPAGGWLIQGLQDGLTAAMPGLERTLAGVSATVAGTQLVATGGLASPDFGDRNANGRDSSRWDPIDYNRLASAMSRVQIGLDGRNVAASVDERIGERLR